LYNIKEEPKYPKKKKTPGKIGHFATKYRYSPSTFSPLRVGKRGHHSRGDEEPQSRRRNEGLKQSQKLNLPIVPNGSEIDNPGNEEMDGEGSRFGLG